MTMTTTTTTIRAHASHQPSWQKFQQNPSKPFPQNNSNNSHLYSQQYSHAYALRLSSLRDRCLASASSHTAQEGNVTVVPRIIELIENVVCTIVGTIVKETPHRPKLVDSTTNQEENNDDDDDEHLKPFRSYCSPNEDVLVLEDESGRVELQSAKGKEGDDEYELNMHSVASGVVAAVTGVVQPNTGIMIVQSVHFPSYDEVKDEEGVKGESERCGAIVNDTAAPQDRDGNSPYVLLLSGLNCGGVDKNNESSQSLKRDMLLDYIAGYTDLNTKDGAKISRVILAGGGCTKPTPPSSSALPSFAQKQAQTNNSKKRSTSDSPSSYTLSISELDLVLSEICASGIPVDILPGKHDPTNANWPQRPLHPCLLPNSSSFENMLVRAPNPYEAEVGGRMFLGSDGANVEDLRRFIGTVVQVDEKDEEIREKKEIVEAKSNIETLSSTLKFAHVCPTGPDSLPTFPCGDVDPFVITSQPDVYFAGNCGKFETKLVSVGGDNKKETRLVCVPNFAETGEVVLLNLGTLDCDVVKFGGVDDDENAMEE